MCTELVLCGWHLFVLLVYAPCIVVVTFVRCIGLLCEVLWEFAVLIKLFFV